MTTDDFEKVPYHCQLWYEEHSGEPNSREVPGFLETLPLGDELAIYLGWGWESAVYKIVVAYENHLILEAEAIRDDAIEVFKRFRSYDNRAPINLGIRVRVRKDTFGPRIDWVRFTGKGASNFSGRTTHFTEPVKCAGKYRTSSKIFQKFPPDIRAELLELEDRATLVRFQTEKLNRLRKLCWEPPSPK